MNHLLAVRSAMLLPPLPKPMRFSRFDTSKDAKHAELELTGPVVDIEPTHDISVIKDDARMVRPPTPSPDSPPHLTFATAL